MAESSDLRSWLVGWLKIVLPLLALAILSTLFLISRRIDPEAAIPYAEVDVQELAREPRIGAPEYAGVTEDGAAVTVSAGSARPDPGEPSRISAEGLRAVLENPGGMRAELTAAEGRIDQAANALTLSGGVEVATSSGYRVETGSLTAALDRTSVVAGGAVTAEAPYGRLEAGGMVLEHAATETGGGYVLVFNEGVRLVYEPER